uniref:Uncharacterized protein n=1 Tax=Arundo donax TaxID=35708 RepID=A0A0A8XT04_ARUDO
MYTHFKLHNSTGELFPSKLSNQIGLS